LALASRSKILRRRSSALRPRVTSASSIGAKLPNWNKLFEKLIEDAPQIREML